LIVIVITDIVTVYQLYTYIDGACTLWPLFVVAETACATGYAYSSVGPADFNFMLFNIGKGICF